MGFWNELFDAVKEGGAMSRDARIGLPGAQQVRDLYQSENEDDKKLAKELTKDYAIADVVGAVLPLALEASGAAPAVMGAVANPANLAKTGFNYLGKFFTPSEWLKGIGYYSPKVASWVANNPTAVSLIDAGVQSAFMADATNRVYNKAKNGELGSEPISDAMDISMLAGPLIQPAIKLRNLKAADITNSIKSLPRDVKNLYKYVNKQFTAPKRIQRYIKNQNEFVNELLDAYNIENNKRLDIGKQIQQLINSPENKLLLEKFKRARMRSNSFNYYTQELAPHVKRRSRNSFLFNAKPHVHGNIDLTKLSEENIHKLIAKRLNLPLDRVQRELPVIKNNAGEWEVIFNNNLPAENGVNTTYKIQDFLDSSHVVEGKIVFAPNQSQSKLNLHNQQYASSGDNTYFLSELQEFNPEYRKLLAKNIQTVKDRMPGFKPFGSASGVVEAGFPHGTHDIDGYMLAKDFEAWRKYNPNIKVSQKSPDTYAVELFPEAGEQGIIDVNILQADKNGYVIGDRALQLARQLFPQKYTSWARQLRKNPAAKLQITPEELLETYHPGAKTVADNFEINAALASKEKQLSRPLIYLSEGDPDVVAEGLRIFGQSHGTTAPFPVTAEELTNPAINIEILKVLKIPVSQQVVNNPKKMKNLLDYWYYQNTVHGRGVSGIKESELEDALLGLWRERLNTGGNAAGAGKNTVLFSDSGYGFGGDIKTSGYGYFQVNPEINTQQSILDRIAEVKKKTGQFDFQFSEQDKDAINNIAKRILGNEIFFDTPNDLVTAIPATDKGQELLTALNKELGIVSLGSNSYGSTYSSLTDALNPNTPVMWNIGNKQVDSSPMHINTRVNNLVNSISQGDTKNNLSHLLSRLPFTHSGHMNSLRMTQDQPLRYTDMLDPEKLIINKTRRQNPDLFNAEKKANEVADKAYARYRHQWNKDHTDWHNAYFDAINKRNKYIVTPATYGIIAGVGSGLTYGGYKGIMNLSDYIHKKQVEKVAEKYKNVDDSELLEMSGKSIYSRSESRDIRTELQRRGYSFDLNTKTWRK